MARTKEQIIERINHSDLFVNMGEEAKQSLLNNISTATDEQLPIIDGIVADAERTFFNSEVYQKLIEASVQLDQAYVHAKKDQNVQAEQQSSEQDDEALKNLENQM